MSKKIYTQTVATNIVELFDDILERYNIRVPSDEDDEREPDAVGLYGTTYFQLLDDVEAVLIPILQSVTPNTEIVIGIYSAGTGQEG